MLRAWVISFDCATFFLSYLFFFGFGFGNGELRRETTTELSLLTLLLCLNVRISDNLLGPEAAAGQAGRPTQATAELPLSVNRCRPNVVVFRLSSSSMRMRCQTKDRRWNFDDDGKGTRAEQAMWPR